MTENLDPETIVTCYGCENRVRAKVIRFVPTGVDGDMRIWCLQCLQDIDNTTEFLLPGTPTPQLESGISKFLLDDEG